MVERPTWTDNLDGADADPRKDNMQTKAHTTARSRFAIFGLALVGLMSGCVAPGGGHHGGGTVRLPGGLVLFNALESVRDCKAERECVQPIGAMGATGAMGALGAMAMPMAPLFDCVIKVQDITVVRQKNGVSSLAWTLPNDTPDIQFRYRTSLKGQAIGVFVFNAGNAFAVDNRPEEPRTFRLKLEGDVRKTTAFKYGIFLDFKTRSDDWQQCAALDPIIVSMD